MEKKPRGEMTREAGQFSALEEGQEGDFAPKMLQNWVNIGWQLSLWLTAALVVLQLLKRGVR